MRPFEPPDDFGARPRVLFWLLALVTPFVAAVMQMPLRPAVNSVPFVFFFPAVALSAWWGGALAGGATTLLSAALGNYFFLPPTHQLSMNDHGLLATALFIMVATMINALAASLRARFDERERLVAEESAARRSFEAAQSEARAANERLRAIVEGISEGIVAQDRTGRLLFVNEAAARIWGSGSARELLATPAASVMARVEVRDEADRELSLDELPSQRTLRGEQTEDVLVMIRPRAARESRWVWWSTVPVADAEMVISVFRDFSDRKRAEEAQSFLAEASRLLGASLDYAQTLRALAQLAVPRLADWCAVEIAQADGSCAPLVVAHVDPKKVELASELRRRWPPGPNAPYGAAQVILSGTPQIHREITDGMLQQMARDPEQLRVSRQLGLRSAMIVPMVSPRGTLGAITLVTAESGRRYDENDLAQAMELASRAALAVDNATLYSEARDAVELRDEFLSIAGHELRTPLTAIQLQLQGVLRSLRRGDAPPPVERTLERIEKACAQVERLEGLVNALLDVSRITSAQLEIAVEEMDLTTLVREVVERFAAQATRAGSTVEVRARERVRGRWDRLRLDQVVTNLVSNAIKYGAGQPVTIVVESNGTRARLVVCDAGIGIGAEDLERIFGRFERAVSERHYGGLGLGLWISRQIVEAHGGTIAAASDPGGRTLFTVELPIVTTS